jgi:ribosomal silencing factor RsfS
MKNLILLLTALSLAFVSNAQSGTEFETEAFHAIQISHSFKVWLEQDDEHSVTAEAPKELMDDIEIRVKEGVLHIGMKDGYKKSKWWKSNKDDIMVHITFPSIDQLSISGSVDLDAKNVLRLEDLAVSTSGASKIHFHTRCDDLSIDLSGASELSLDAYADNFSLMSSGASKVVVTGETDDFNLTCSGASDIDAGRLKAEEVSIDCSGASSIHAWATDEIIVDAAGTSSIKYKCEGCDDSAVRANAASSVKKY